jgi:hypothetical protein
MTGLQLLIRYGKGGRVSSPVSTIGYLSQAGFVIGLVGFLWKGALRDGHAAEWALAAPIGAFLVFRASRDLLAWLTASASERASFRAQVRSLREEREELRRAGPKRPMTRRESLGYVVLLTLSVGFFGYQLARVALRSGLRADPGAAALAAVLLGAWLAGTVLIVRKYRRERPRAAGRALSPPG